MNFEALAWAIDCEGSLKLVKRKKIHGKYNPTYQAHIQIAMCDKEFPYKMKEIFQCGNVYLRTREKLDQRPLWSWIVQKQTDVERLLKNCLPYFILKREKAEEMLVFLKIKGDNNHRDLITGRYGHIDPAKLVCYEKHYQRVRQLTTRLGPWHVTPIVVGGRF